MDTAVLSDLAKEQKPIVCFLGPMATYSHQATLEAFKTSEWHLMPVLTIKDIFDTVQAGNAAYGVVPFENSTNGTVVMSLNCFADRDNVYPDLEVCGEVYLDVHHYLVGFRQPSSPRSGREDDMSTEVGTSTPTAYDPHPRTPKSKPLSSLQHIEKLYSHPQAWGQVEAFVSTYLKGIEQIDVSSTSKAAEIVKAEGPEEGSAAVSSVLAAEILGLDVLARCIEDRDDNTTRFFVIRRGGEVVSPPVSFNKPPNQNSVKQQGNNEDRHDNVLGTKSMVSFTISHRSPGALADVLNGFRKYGLNLTSINSRPSLANPFQYIFFVEFEGHKFDDLDGRVKGALEEVAKAAATWRWLGSWVAQR